LVQFWKNIGNVGVFGLIVCVSYLVFWKGTVRLANRGNYHHTQEGRQERMPNYQDMSLLSIHGKAYAKCFEKRCREIIKPKLDDT